MKKSLLISLFLITFSGCASDISDFPQTIGPDNISLNTNSSLKENKSYKYAPGTQKKVRASNVVRNNPELGVLGRFARNILANKPADVADEQAYSDYYFKNEIFKQLLEVPNAKAIFLITTSASIIDNLEKESSKSILADGLFRTMVNFKDKDLNSGKAFVNFIANSINNIDEADKYYFAKTLLLNILNNPGTNPETKEAIQGLLKEVENIATWEDSVAHVKDFLESIRL